MVSKWSVYDLKEQANRDTWAAVAVPKQDTTPKLQLSVRGMDTKGLTFGL